MTGADQEVAFDTALAVRLLEAVDAVEAGDLSLRDGGITVSLRRDAAVSPVRGGKA